MIYKILGEAISKDIDKKDYDDIKKEVMKEVKREMKPELINRIDEIIVFHKLNDNEIKSIANIMIKQLEDKLKDEKYNVEIDNSVTQLVLNKEIDKNFGARPLRKIIQNFVEIQIAEKILDGQLKKSYNPIKIIAENNEIKIKMGNN